jgi:hypothetical protein
MHWTAGFRPCYISDATGPPPVMSVVKQQPRRVMGTKKKAGWFAVRCPNCGSQNTKIDWTSSYNYRMALLAVIIAIAGTWPRGYNRVCLDCRSKFSP